MKILRICWKSGSILFAKITAENRFQGLLCFNFSGLQVISEWMDPK